MRMETNDQIPEGVLVVEGSLADVLGLVGLRPSRLMPFSNVSPHCQENPPAAVELRTLLTPLQRTATFARGPHLISDMEVLLEPVGTRL
jgi:hypothetical protein